MKIKFSKNSINLFYSRNSIGNSSFQKFEFLPKFSPPRAQQQINQDKQSSVVRVVELLLPLSFPQHAHPTHIIKLLFPSNKLFAGTEKIFRQIKFSYGKLLHPQDRQMMIRRFSHGKPVKHQIKSHFLTLDEDEEKKGSRYMREKLMWRFVRLIRNILGKIRQKRKNLWKWCCCVFVLMMMPCWASALLSNGRDSQPDTFQQIALVMKRVSSSTLNSVEV